MWDTACAHARRRHTPSQIPHLVCARSQVKPKLASLKHASLVVPTIRGYINVTATSDATRSTLTVRVTCNTVAQLCLPRSAHAKTLLTPRSTRLLLDGSEIAAVASGGHLCASHLLGCGQGGAPRQLSAEPRAGGEA